MKMVDMSGYWNDKHRLWTFPGDCRTCERDRCRKGRSFHRNLELLLRQAMTNKLQIERDNFDRIFKLYPGLILQKSHHTATVDETAFIKYHLEHKMVAGVFPLHPANNSHYFVVPVMKGGKMWQMLVRGENECVDAETWQAFRERPLSCLLCTDHPFDMYPCNFVAGENVYSVRSILWPDHRRPHQRRDVGDVISYGPSSRVIVWPPRLARPFLDEAINHAGNMGVYTTGEIFVRTLELVLDKVDKDGRASTLFKNKGMALRRGEIDEAITQTRQLHKMDGCDGRSPKVGRYNKNVAGNSYVNMCIAACGLQKVLPKDSKAFEPRTVAESDVGFIDPLHTPDTPQRCGILLETVPDLVISSSSMCATNLLALLRQELPSLVPQDPSTIPDGGGGWILVNHLHPYQVVDDKMDEEAYVGISYRLKRQIPCVELLHHDSKFWSCTSLSRMWYKIGTNGLLYTPKELDFAPTVDHPAELQWWAPRETLPNLTGPSLAGVARPNAVHLPRVSNACCAMRHYAGPSHNSHATGEVHQKTVLACHYTFREQSGDMLPIPAQYPLVCVVNWNNPEDGITIKASSVQRGMFRGDSVETLIVTVVCPTPPLVFDPSPSVGRGPLYDGTVLGRVRGVGVTVTDVRNYAHDAGVGGCDIECRQDDDDEIVLVWRTVRGEDDIDDGLEVPFRGDEKNWRLVGLEERRRQTKRFHFSLAYNESRPTRRHHRCNGLYFEEAQQPPPSNKRAQPCTRWIRVVVCSSFVPSLGDKLQTPTSQKGVIGCVIANDADVPFVNIWTLDKPGQQKTLDNKKPNKYRLDSILPDMLINPHFIKRQAFDLFTQRGREAPGYDPGSYADACFKFSFGQALRCLKLGKKELTGPLINPYTGRMMCKRASLYTGRYVCVNNHRPSASLHASRPGETRVSELSGAPVRGKDGGLAIGPMEHSALSDAQRIDVELGHMRSTYEPVHLGGQRVAGSASFRRVNDDWAQAGLSFGYECTKMCR